MSKKETEEKTPVYPLRQPIKGYVPESFRIPITTILKSGHIRELLGSMKKRRDKVGLDTIPPTAYKNEKALEDFLELVSKTKFDELIGYDLNKKKLKY